MDISLARQIASLAGALLILIAYARQQAHWIDSRKAVVAGPKRLNDSRLD
jgi:hypothetical protein